ncbi:MULTISPECIES: hypothetical protein [unclassified Bradyrhizobium]|uniref:hypothetical protein n=1 Tax=unclassified Bradyrhizobium TaxID=2631580 RepID=UPI0028F07BE5|nr:MULTISPECIES: hypothetical protein [unclassified Bradyrhizobium]
MGTDRAACRGADHLHLAGVNGRPFLIREFFTDGGGFVVDWKGGTLSRPLPGGCSVSVRFGSDDHEGNPIGDRIASDKAELRKWGPVVEQIVVSFPEK